MKAWLQCSVGEDGTDVVAVLTRALPDVWTLRDCGNDPLKRSDGYQIVVVCRHLAPMSCRVT